MSTTITPLEVENIAALARLELNEEEKQTYAGQLSAILGYIDQLNEVNTENTPITTQVTGLSNVVREDVVDPCGHPEKIIAQAPSHNDNLVTVKAVFN